MISQTLNFNSQNPKFVKHLSLLVAIYTFCFILPTILLKRTVILPYFGLIPISIFFTGSYFVLLDIITEVYGYYEAKKVIYAGLTAYSLFVWVVEAIIFYNPNIPNEHIVQIHNNQAYSLIFNNIYVTWFSVLICTLVFDILNARLLSKWKFLLNGKYFIVRSILSSSISMILFSLVTNFFAFYQQIFSGDFEFYIKVNVISLSAKLLSLLICAYPAMILCKFLKKSENLDITINTNIFLFNKVKK